MNTIINDFAKSINEELKNTCKEIGCSGLSNKCPGNMQCTILRKIYRDKK
jgi:hypothetical protein